MRLFIAIKIPENFLENIKKIQDSLPPFFGKKTDSKNIHLTLKFLGEINEEDAKKVKSLLKKVKHKKFETNLNGIGLFDKGDGGIVWMGMENCEELQGKIDELLKELFSKEKRFMGHLTIARVKKFQNRKKFFDSVKKIKFQKMSFTVNEFYLIKSHLKLDGAEYKIIEKYELD